jgi:hypothetical protein
VSCLFALQQEFASGSTPRTVGADAERERKGDRLGDLLRQRERIPEEDQKGRILLARELRRALELASSKEEKAHESALVQQRQVLAPEDILFAAGNNADSTTRDVDTCTLNELVFSVASDAGANQGADECADGGHDGGREREHILRRARWQIARARDPCVSIRGGVRVGPGDELGGREACLACAVVRGAIEVCDGEAGLCERAAQVRSAHAECGRRV